MIKLTACVTLATVVFAAVAQGQTGSTQALSHAIHAVEDLDTTLAFYRDVLGLDGKPVDFPNPAVPPLTNAPGVTLRLSMMSLPGVRFELTHFKGLERKPGRARYTDPSAGSLVLFVRDIDIAVANAKKANAEIVTTGGEPVEISMGNRKARSIILRDPDGFFLQLVETPVTGDALPGNVQRVSLAYRMDNADATRNFYTGMMDIDLTGPTPWSNEAAYLKLAGAPAGTEFRNLTGTLPGPTPTQIRFTEFRGLPRTKFHLRVRDPGAPAMAILVFELRPMVEKMRAAGVNILSANGQIVDFGRGSHNIFVEDPNGMNLELIERKPSTAK
jgi:catechol 2,3-dioxygenase-like lactoylglutathione lyase family enzyme